MNGYECQIQNGYKDGDRTKPLDCGTGGFYRRQDARMVVADDFTWFTHDARRHGPAHGRLGQRLSSERLDRHRDRRTPTRAKACASSRERSSCKATTRRRISRSAICSAAELPKR